MEANKTGINIHEFVEIETYVCNCWTNDYTLDQLDAGKSVHGGIEYVTVCHLDYNIYFRPVHLRCTL